MPVPAPEKGAARRARRAARPREAGPGAVPWIRARLRAAPGQALATGVLVMVTAFLLAALPRAVDSYESGALREALARAQADRRSVTVTADVLARDASPGRSPVPSDAELAATAEAFRDVVRPPVVPQPGADVHGVRNGTPAPTLGRALPRPAQLDPRATVVVPPREVLSGLRTVTGRLPAEAPGDDVVEAVLTARTAEVMGLEAGSSVRLATVDGAPLTVRITGTVEPRGPRPALWTAVPVVRGPAMVWVPGRGDPRGYWHFGLLSGGGAREALLRLEGGAVAFWHHPLRLEDLTPDEVPAAQRALASLSGGSDAARLQARSPVEGAVVDGDGLDALLAAFAAERRAAGPLVLVAAVGVASVAAVVLLMAGGLAAAGRRTETALLRARGGSLPGIARLLAAETAVVAVPAAAAGVLCALLLVPSRRWAAALLLGAAVAATACLALPLRAVVAHRTPWAAAREDLTAARPSRRRVVVELTVVVLVAGALAASRSGASAGVLTAAAPVLIATAAALLLRRIHPIPLRLLARATDRLSGAVVHLAVVRAGRAPAAAVMPLAAVLVALTVASFGGSVLAGVADGRSRAARAAVGADARIEAPASLPEGLAARIRRVDGVEEAAAVRVEYGLRTAGFSRPFALVAVDPSSYARLAARTGPDGGGFPAAALGRYGGTGPLPAVVSPGLAEDLGGGAATVATDSGSVGIRAAAVRAAAPAVEGDFAVVSAASLARSRPDGPGRTDGTDGTDGTEPTVLLVGGAHLDGARLRDAARGAGTGLAVKLYSEELARYESTPLQTGARLLYLAAVAACAGYGALALLLALLRTAPGRRALLARLRTMGTSRRQAHALAFLEALPPIVLAAAGGILTGLAAVLLLRPGVDLTALAFSADARGKGATVQAVLTPDPGTLLWPPAGVLVLACTVLALQTWLSGLRGPGTELRTEEHT
ncbi:ABC transporter permease [Streptomyces sp. SCUT-3]|uniref:ABC transporter permease n=1 Tax=Streptomyces sp. SCUT-3 TaxID=2684469 RepID=UPI0015F8FF76|nr:ABC transporter permease [Streptomyces sp. SCUT-3]QMV20670.1 ABC transporter permease [Streptomyces sp. SCUT-3]